MISVDISVLYQVVIFLVLWLVLSKLVFRPYITLLEDRERRTSGTSEDASELEEQAGRLKAMYEAKITEARNAAIAVRDAIIQEARRERERVLQAAREEAAVKLDRVRREVQTQMERERALLAAEANNIAQEMASKILGRRVG
jgi:F-type H+-transporting ATPase subunit b